MTILPIVQLELRRSARIAKTYWMRSVAGLLPMFAIGYFLLARGPGLAPGNGRLVFFVVGMAAALYCLLAGLFFTVDSLSFEKRNGTMGLLFLTDLKGYDVVLGKMAASSLGAIYGLVAVFPVMEISLLQGGVSLADYCKGVFALLNLLFYSLSLGMYASSRCVSAGKAISLNIGLLLFTSFLGPGIEVLTDIGAFRPLSTIYFLPAIFAQFGGAFTFSGTLLSAAYTLTLGIGFFVCACRHSTESWQDKPESLLREKWRNWWNQRLAGDRKFRSGFRTRLLNVHPIYWLAIRRHSNGLWFWMVLLGSSPLWIWLLSNTRWIDRDFFLNACLFLNTLLKALVSFYAARMVAEEFASGSVELLLSTPLGVWDILKGQFLALRRQFLGPLVCLFLLNAVLLVATFDQNVFNSWEKPGAVLMRLSMMAILVADTLTVAVVGIWRAMIEKNPVQAGFQTILRVVVMPSILGTVWADVVLGNLFYSSYSFKALTWLTISLGVDCFYLIRAKRILSNQLREYAMGRYSPPPKVPWWRFEASPKKN